MRVTWKASWGCLMITEGTRESCWALGDHVEGTWRSSEDQVEVTVGLTWGQVGVRGVSL